MLRRVDPPGLAVEAEAAEHVALELLLPGDRKLPAQERVVDCARGRGGAISGHEHLLQPLEDRPDLGRRHALLEVVEQRVVGLRLGRHALDVAALQLDVRSR